MSHEEPPQSDAGRLLERLEQSSLSEISLLQEEIKSLQNEIFQLRSSTIFRLREKILPDGSFLQQLFLALKTGKRIRSHKPDEVGYAEWVTLWDTLTETDLSIIRADVEEGKLAVHFSLLLRSGTASCQAVIETIESVKSQLYPHWNLFVFLENSTDPEMTETLVKISEEDSRIKIVTTKEGRKASSGGFVGFIEGGDFVPKHALYTVAKYIEQFPKTKLLYSDEDEIDDRGNRAQPKFKPDWDPLLSMAFNYPGHLTLFEAETLKSIGELRVEGDSLKDWDLLLRVSERLADYSVVHVPHILYHRRTHPQYKKKDVLGRAQVVQQALDRRGETATATEVEKWGTVQVTYQLASPAPRVSVIIPTRDRVDVLSKCLDSLFKLTDYPDYEIVILDNGSTEPESLRYFDALNHRDNVKILRVDGPFNYSELNNRGASESSGQVLALLNNDIEIIEPNWMQRLTAYAVRPNIGAVGARLLYPDGRVQHAGVLVGFQKLAAHYHLRLPGDQRGYMGRAIVDQTMSAVTGACLLVTRENFDKVGGLDERLAVAFNDVDFCLKLQAVGLRNVYAGSVTCIHHESVSRGLDDTPEKMTRASFEALRLRSRWQSNVAKDPAYNPNMCLVTQPFAIADRPGVEWPWRVSKEFDHGHK